MSVFVYTFALLILFAPTAQRAGSTFSVDSSRSRSRRSRVFFDFSMRDAFHVKPLTAHSEALPRSARRQEGSSRARASFGGSVGPCGRRSLWKLCSRSVETPILQTPTVSSDSEPLLTSKKASKAWGDVPFLSFFCEGTS